MIALRHVVGAVARAPPSRPSRPPAVPSTQSCTWSMAALAAEAADEAPRASMIAAPRLPTVGMKSFSSQSWSWPIASQARLAAHLGVEHVRVHRGRVVAPHREVGDVGHRRARLLGELGHRPVLVEPGHGGEALARARRRRSTCAISALVLAGLPTTSTLHVVGGAGGDRLALRLEDAAVGLEQVGALHALRARARAHEQAHVGAVEGLLRVVGDVDPGAAAGRRSRRAPSPCPRRPSRRRGSPAGCSCTGVSSPSIWPLAMRKSRA